MHHCTTLKLKFKIQPFSVTAFTTPYLEVKVWPATVWLSLLQLRRLHQYVVDNITISSTVHGQDGAPLRYVDVCPKRDHLCVVDGREVLYPADPKASDRFRCVRRSDRATMKAAAAAGISYEAASGSPGQAQNRATGKDLLLTYRVAQKSKLLTQYNSLLFWATLFYQAAWLHMTASLQFFLVFLPAFKLSF